jgi:hypothetical protein
VKKALPWFVLAALVAAVGGSIAWRFRGEHEFVFDTKSVRMEVVNGCGVPRVGRAVADELQMRGYDVYSVGSDGRHYQRTVVVDLRDRLARNARNVARSMGVQRRIGRFPVGRPAMPAVAAAVDSARFLDVRLVVGDDFRRFFPTVTPLY